MTTESAGRPADVIGSAARLTTSVVVGVAGSTNRDPVSHPPFGPHEIRSAEGEVLVSSTKVQERSAGEMKNSTPLNSFNS